MNEVYFTEEEVKAGNHIDLINFLMDQSYGKGNLYNDIRIKPEDSGAFIVQWAQLPWSHDYGGRWVFLDEDEDVIVEIRMPDGTYQEVHRGDERLALEDWWEEHPDFEDPNYDLRDGPDFG